MLLGVVHAQQWEKINKPAYYREPGKNICLTVLAVTGIPLYTQEGGAAMACVVLHL